MNCLQFEEKIAQAVDDGMVQEHLRICSACARFADQLESDRRLLQSVPPETADVDFAAMRRQIRSAIVEKRRRNRIVPLLLLAASILIAMVLTSVRLQQKPRTAQVNPPVDSRQAKPPAPPIQPVLVGKATVVQKVVQAVSPAKKHHLTSPTPQPDPALEAALSDFIFRQTAPAPAPANQIRIATNDPNIILILLPETNGASNE